MLAERPHRAIDESSPSSLATATAHRVLWRDMGLDHMDNDSSLKPEDAHMSPFVQRTFDKARQGISLGRLAFVAIALTARGAANA